MIVKHVVKVLANSEEDAIELAEPYAGKYFECSGQPYRIYSIVSRSTDSLIDPTYSFTVTFEQEGWV